MSRAPRYIYPCSLLCLWRRDTPGASPAWRVKNLRKIRRISEQNFKWRVYDKDRMYCGLEKWHLARLITWKCLVRFQDPQLTAVWLSSDQNQHSRTRIESTVTAFTITHTWQPIPAATKAAVGTVAPCGNVNKQTERQDRPKNTP